MSRGPDRSIESGPDPLRLEQVPAFVPRQNFGSRAHREADHPDKRVLETDPVDVVVTRALHELADGAVARVEPVEHGRRDLGARSDLLGGPPAPRLGRWFDDRANEPATEPSRRDLRNEAGTPSFQRPRHRPQVHLIRNRKVLKALAHTPLGGTASPVELVGSEAMRDRGRALIGRIELGIQTEQPGGRGTADRVGHAGKIGDSAARSETGTVLVFTTRLCVYPSECLVVWIGGRAAEGTRLESA